METTPFDDFSYFKTFFNTVLQVIVVIFASGPVKVFLDVKRGETSMKEMMDDMNDDRMWIHKTFGVDER